MRYRRGSYGSISVQPAQYAPAERDGIGASAVELGLGSWKGATPASAGCTAASRTLAQNKCPAMNGVFQGIELLDVYPAAVHTYPNIHERFDGDLGNAAKQDMDMRTFKRIAVFDGKEIGDGALVDLGKLTQEVRHVLAVEIMGLLHRSHGTDVRHGGVVGDALAPE